MLFRKSSYGNFRKKNKGIYMKYCLFLTLLLSSGCSQMPSFFQSVDDIETNSVIKVEIDKEAFQKDTDININIDVKNKDIALKE